MADDLPHQCVRVDLACNDDHGRCIHRAQGLQITGRGAPLIELEAAGRGVSIGISPGRLVFSRKTFATCGQAHWVGSTAWEGLWMTVEEAARLLLWAHDKGAFDIVSAEAGVFAMWRRHDPFRGPHLIEHLTLAGRAQQGGA